MIKRGAPLWACGAALLLAACGGGSGSSTGGPTPTPDPPAMVRGLDCSGPDSSGWCWQEPQPGATAMIDAHFVDTSNGWAVGEGGTVLRTSDGGRSWTRRHIGASGMLTSVRFADAQTGWILGSEQSWFTRDGGSTWSSRGWMGKVGDKVWVQSDGTVVRSPDEPAGGFTEGTFTASPTTPDWRFVPMWVSAVTQPGANRSTWHGVIVGATGPRRWGRSTDNGQSFIAQGQVPPEQWLLGLGPLDGSSLWAQVAIPAPDFSGYTRDQIVRSSDDGATWGAAVDLPTDRHVEVKALRADGRGLGWSRTTDDLRQGIDRRTLEATGDGGRSWVELRTPDGRLDDPRLDTQWLLGPRAAGGLWLSDDLGAHWTALPAPPATVGRLLSREPGVLTFSSVTGNHGGQIYRSRDRGQSWTRTPYRETGDDIVTQLWFFDALNGMAVRSGEPSQVLDTADGGRTWTPRTAALLPGRGLHFTPEGTGYALGGSSTGYLRSTDRGRTWAAFPAPGSLARPSMTSLRFLDERSGWAVVADLVCPKACFPSQQTLFVTEDGGRNWTRRASGGPQDFLSLTFATPNVAVTVDGAGRLWRSGNGGSDWTEITGPGLLAPVDPQGGIRFADASSGLIGQPGHVLRTQDGGLTWQRIELPTQADARLLLPRQFHFTDPQHAFAVADTDLLLTTGDGGRTWSARRTGTGVAVATLFAMDANRIWLGGSRGAILATATGGR